MDDNKRLGDDLNGEGWLALSPAERRLMRDDPTDTERAMAEANPECWHCGGKGRLFDVSPYDPRHCPECVQHKLRRVIDGWALP